MIKAQRIADYWHRVYKQRYSARLGDFNFEGVVGIGSGRLRATGGIALLCGANGTGKSTLLAAIGHLSSRPEESRLPSHVADRFRDASLEATMYSEASPVLLKREGQLPPVREPESFEVAPIYFLDASARCAEILLDLNKRKPSADDLNGVDPRGADADEVAVLSWLVGKTYSRCDTYELDIFGEEPVPYFRVECEGSTYGSESMGLGELCLHYICWFLRTCADNSILLLEEPEAHVAPRSQAALLDHLAVVSCERNLWVLVSTHSSTIASKVPLRSTVLARRNQVGVVLEEDPRYEDVARTVGIEPILKYVFIVEDAMAAEFLRELLHRHLPDVAPHSEIGVGGSNGEIVQAMSSFPPLSRRFTLIGCFDGNDRGKHQKLISAWPVVFLPTVHSPERVLRDYVASGIDLSALVMLEADSVATCLQEIAQLEDHDWLEELARRTNFRKTDLAARLFRAYASDPANLVRCRDFAKDVASAVELSVGERENTIFHHQNQRRGKGRLKGSSK